MQAAFQDHVHDSISKTVNMAHESTVEDVLAVYNLAIGAGVKGVTIFRDGSIIGGQVLSADNDDGRCPECSGELTHQEGCSSCVSCGYSACEV